jgi:hypothetical protein
MLKFLFKVSFGVCGLESDVFAGWLALLFHFYEVLGSVLGPEAGYY